MKKLRKFASVLMLAATVVFAAGCTKPDEPNNEGNDNSGGGGETPEVPTIPTGAIDGAFSINENGGKVYFSQGNLQYQASTNTWRFAEHQWDYVGHDYAVFGPYGTPTGEVIHMGTVPGSNNREIAPDYPGWIDLFGFGTSGFNGKQPYMTSMDSGDYGDGENDIAGTNYDWGVYNAISNGGNQSGLWRTLTKDEWTYIVALRQTTSGIRHAPATVNGVHGLIILPDDWNSSIYDLNYVNDAWDGWPANDIDEATWTNTFEPAGAVFMPTAGDRRGSTEGGGTGPEGQLPFLGFYWSSTYSKCLFFERGVYPDYGSYAREGHSVRLVADAK